MTVGAALYQPQLGSQRQTAGNTVARLQIRVVFLFEIFEIKQTVRMTSILSAFKAVSLIFAAAAVGTGLHAIVDPVGFSKSFGLQISPPATPDAGTLKKDAATRNLMYTTDGPTPKEEAAISSNRRRRVAMSYVSLMGVRQLATGTILLTFAYQGKWTEMATILAIIGILVAGTDGIYLSRDGAKKLGQFHALPGALISALACAVIWTES